MFIDAEIGYASSSPTVDMIKSFLAKYAIGLNSDIGAGWSCSELNSIMGALGGASALMPQNHRKGDMGDYTGCSVSGLGGVTIWDVGGETPTCGSSSLGYQGGINNFASAFKACPTWVLVAGGWANTVNASSLTCTA